MDPHNDPFHRALVSIGSLAMIGAVIGIGKLLLSNERITIRVVIGRAITSAALGAASAAILAFFPDIPIVAQFGIAAAASSLGTSGLERLFKDIFGIKQ